MNEDEMDITEFFKHMAAASPKEEREPTILPEATAYDLQVKLERLMTPSAPPTTAWPYGTVLIPKEGVKRHNVEMAIAVIVGEDKARAFLHKCPEICAPTNVPVDMIVGALSDEDEERTLFLFPSWTALWKPFAEGAQ